MIEVKVVPNAKKQRISETEQGLQVYVTAPAVDGRANQVLIGMLAKHFCVRKYQIEIIKGLKSRRKLISIKANFS